MTIHRLALALRSAYLAMHRRTDAALADLGITADQFVVLDALQSAGSASQHELVMRTDSDPNTLRAMLVLLERRELVERRPHPTDRRARSVAITAAGRSALERAWESTESLRAEMHAALAPREAARVTRQLAQFAQHMQPRRTRQRPAASSGRISSRVSSSTSRRIRP